MMYRQLYDSYAHRLVSKPAVKHIPNKGIMLLSSALMAFAWVGSYRYQYNISLFNTHGINIWAFFLWVLTGYITLQIIFFFKDKVRYAMLHLVISWSVYFAGLVLFEYLGYYIFNIREQSASPRDALVFGVIHGTPALHTYYMLFPLLISCVYRAVFSGTSSIYRNMSVLRYTFITTKFKTRP